MKSNASLTKNAAHAAVSYRRSASSVVLRVLRRSHLLYSAFSHRLYPCKGSAASYAGAVLPQIHHGEQLPAARPY